MPLCHEQHYSPQELAAKWGWSDETVRRVVKEEPGVLKLERPSRRVGRKLTRHYTTYRIPYSVAERIHARLSR